MAHASLSAVLLLCLAMAASAQLSPTFYQTSCPNALSTIKAAVTAAVNKEKAVIVQPERVTVGNGPTFGCVMMKDFLSELAKRLMNKKRNTTAYDC